MNDLENVIIAPCPITEITKEPLLKYTGYNIQILLLLFFLFYLSYFAESGHSYLNVYLFIIDLRYTPIMGNNGHVIRRKENFKRKVMNINDNTT